MGNNFSSKTVTIVIGTSISLACGILLYKFLNSSKNKKSITLADHQIKYPLKLVYKEELTHDTRLFRFGLTSDEHELGIKLGQHISLSTRINGELVVRSYTPTSVIDQKGYFELCVKIYRANSHPKFPNGGKMSQFLEAMKIGDEVDVRGPIGKLSYLRNGSFEMRVDRKTPPKTQKIQQIGMICGGTGITPMFQLIQDICNHSEDKTEISLIFTNKTTDDIMLRDNLELYRKKSEKFKIWYTVGKSFEDDWKYDTSFVNEEMIKKHMPLPSSETLIMLCGTPSLVKDICLPNLKKLGYTKDMIYSC